MKRKYWVVQFKNARDAERLGEMFGPRGDRWQIYHTPNDWYDTTHWLIENRLEIDQAIVRLMWDGFEIELDDVSVPQAVVNYPS